MQAEELEWMKLGVDVFIWLNQLFLKLDSDISYCLKIDNFWLNVYPNEWFRVYNILLEIKQNPLLYFSTPPKK